MNNILITLNGQYLNGIRTANLEKMEDGHLRLTTEIVLDENDELHQKFLTQNDETFDLRYNSGIEKTEGRFKTRITVRDKITSYAVDNNVTLLVISFTNNL